MNVLEMRVFHTFPPIECSACGKYKPLEAFANHRGGKAYVCKQCASEQATRARKKKVSA